MNLETKLLDGFSHLKDEVIDLKDEVIGNLQEENAKLRSRVEILENKFKHLQQYDRSDSFNVFRIPNSISNKKLKCSVILIMKEIDTEVNDRDTEACHRLGKSKGNSKKSIVWFCNRKFSERALYNKKKLASVNTSVVGLGNSTKLFIGENLTDYNHKLAFNCRKLKRASLNHSIFTRDGVVHIIVRS